MRQIKIFHKIIAANLANILLIVVTGFLAYHSLETVLTKLKFMEIADSMGSDFLEMRLAEKNFFLYGEKAALSEIESKINATKKTIKRSRPDIVRAIGDPKTTGLESDLDNYSRTLKKARIGDTGAQAKVRAAGHKLMDFIIYNTSYERAEVHNILAGSAKGLFLSFVLILFTAVGVTLLLSVRVLGSLKRIEKAAHLISGGEFEKIEPESSMDECGIAVSALRSMAGELRNREEQMLEARKLASIGILIAGVSHEIGNPLNNISMLAQNFVELYDRMDREEHIEYVKKIEDETERIQRIVKDLLDFARPKKPDFKETDINGVIDKSMRLVQNMMSVCNIDSRLELEEPLPTVYIDEHQIQGVLVNLITNSIHASSPGDRLRVATRLNPDSDRVEIEVEDTGKGMAPEVLPHIFDPFFTTKGASGTGLGLFVSYGIIKNHKGEMRARSEVGTGTCFTIELPVHSRLERSEQCLVSGS
ncbi:MAG: ATP-binding protein [Syntrophobacteraceae bacterium]|nr:ATP-binding protein [Syntrophobacteraceae bacterium]